LRSKAEADWSSRPAFLTGRRCIPATAKLPKKEKGQTRFRSKPGVMKVVRSEMFFIRNDIWEVMVNEIIEIDAKIKSNLGSILVA
jgi:hypothetical protein